MQHARPRVEGAQQLLVRPVERLDRDALGRPDEVHPVHLAPVVGADLRAVEVDVDRRARVRRELGQVHHVHRDAPHEVARGLDRLVVLAGVAEHEEALGADAGLVRPAHRLFRALDAGGLVHRDQQLVRPGLEPEADLPAARLLHHREHAGLHGVDARGAGPRDLQARGEQALAELRHADAAREEQVVHEHDVPHAPALVQVLDHLHHARRRVGAQARAEGRGVAELAVEGAAARRGDRGDRAARVVVDRGRVRLREAGQEVPRRHRQVVEVLRDGARRVLAHRRAVAPEQARDAVERGARLERLEQLDQRPLAFAVHGEVELLEALERLAAHRRHVRAADDHRDVRQRLPYAARDQRGRPDTDGEERDAEVARRGRDDALDHRLLVEALDVALHDRDAVAVVAHHRREVEQAERRRAVRDVADELVPGCDAFVGRIDEHDVAHDARTLALRPAPQEGYGERAERAGRPFHAPPRSASTLTSTPTAAIQLPTTRIPTWSQKARARNARFSTWKSSRPRPIVKPVT